MCVTQFYNKVNTELCVQLSMCFSGVSAGAGGDDKG